MPAEPTAQLDAAVVRQVELTVMPNVSTIIAGDSTLVTGGYFEVDSGYGYRRVWEDEVVYLDPTAIITVGNFTGIKAGEDLRGDPVLMFKLDDIGTLRWKVGTRLSIDRRIAFVVQNEVVSMPQVLNEIPNGRTELSLGSQSTRSCDEYARIILNEMGRIERRK